MAETIRTDTMATTVLRRGAPPTIRVTREVRVHSIRTDRADVSVLRDLVAALDEADAPGFALLEAERSATGHLSQLRVRWSDDVPQEAEPESAP